MDVLVFKPHVDGFSRKREAVSMGLGTSLRFVCLEDQELRLRFQGHLHPNKNRKTSPAHGHKALNTDVPELEDGHLPIPTHVDN